MKTRHRISLDGVWQFWLDSDRGLDPEHLSNRAARQMAVPSVWQADPELRDTTGQAWYRTRFTLPQAWLDGCAAVLHFGAVEDEAEVWVNGQRAGEHVGGYLPFELDVTRLCRVGENILTVRVDDPLERFAEIPHGKQSWYGMQSGIWQSVWLESRAPVHIQLVRVSTTENEVHTRIELNEDFPDGWGMRLEISGQDGSSAGECLSRELVMRCLVKEPRLWDIDAPNLYQVNATLLDGQGAEVDRLETSFGFRTIEAKDGRILLNGRPIYLRGALDQDYYPDGFGVPPSLEFLEDTFRKARAMGFNCLRIHIKIPDPRYYEVADRVGMLVWTELPNWKLLTEQTRERARQTLEGMLERDGNHPSIIIWTLINESWGLDLTQPDERAWLAETYAEMKALDPTRLVVGNSACWGNFHVATDIEDFHIYYAMPDHADRWREWVEKFSTRPWWTFAHAYESYPRWREFTRDPWNAPACLPASEVVRRGDEPLLVSEFGNWGLPDLVGLWRGYGGEPWWFETGSSWGDGVVYPHGAAQRFKEYHLQRAFGSLAGLTCASQRMQFESLKYEIEQMRWRESIQGYVITELTDVLWESNGLLNMLREPKSHFGQLAAINGDDLVLAGVERRVYRPGEAVSVQVGLSHYSAASTQESRVEWRLAGEQERLAGSLVTSPVEHASVMSAGRISFAVPQVERPERMTLEVKWTAGRSVLSTNQVEILVLPETRLEMRGPIYAEGGVAEELRELGYELVEDLAQSRAAVVEVMTDALREYLIGGGKILWLASSEESRQTNLPHLFVCPRKGSLWQGDWASSLGWISSDRLFQDLGLEGLVDFSFLDLTPDVVLDGFAPLEFAREVHAGLFVGWIHKPAATIGERRLGRGRLLACTFRLAGNLRSNPLAAEMFKSMLAELV